MNAREILANGLWNHRHDAWFNCSCGWKGDGFGDPYRAHVSDAVLAALADAGFRVTGLENLRRAELPVGPATWNGAKTHCPQGHAYTEDNIYWSIGRRGSRQRRCKLCQHERDRRRNAPIEESS